MATITAAMVKEIRDATGAGMMDCKKALVAADGNMQAAIDAMRKSGAAKAAKKYAHKVTTNEALVIAEELDEVGQKINEGFVNRRYKESAPKVQMTPEEAYKAAEASLNKAKEALAKAQATLEKRQAAFDEAKAAFEAQGSEPSEEGGQGEDDMM